MDLGFETCGNATIIAYDAGEPILVTDPWTHGQQYFGSWKLPFEVPERQLDAIAATRFIWLSHGHPDHLNLDSLERVKDRKLLIPAHYGKRILNDLVGMGYDAVEIRSREWIQLSPRIRLMCLTDWTQDAVCLIAFGDECVVLNLNDSSVHGGVRFVQKQIAEFKRRFVLRLVNYGDADMMNFLREDGTRILPQAAEKPVLGHAYNKLMKRWGGTHSAIFSCNHVYGRADSAWAAEYETPTEAHAQGFDTSQAEFIPSYFAYDVLKDDIAPLPMVPVERLFKDPSEFEDNWADELDAADAAACAAYFKQFDHLNRRMGFINLRVGGQDNVIDMAGERRNGITFEVPRGSLMKAVEWQIFDDLLIGNFMKTTLHGGVTSLYPHFNPMVPKIGDNGGARTDKEVRRYFRHYARESGFEYWASKLQYDSIQTIRHVIKRNPHVRKVARQVKLSLRG